ncbi:MAG: glutamate racemase [Candidatus Eisenbacteria bacterium]
MLSEKRPIGMFDSGIGGLTVLKAIMDRMPNENMVYFGDTARLPYGSKSSETITRFSEEITNFLLTKNPKMIVVACNTASAYSLPRIESMVKIPVVGVIEPGANAAIRVTRNRKIGVIGTRATVQSGAYLDAIQSKDSSVKVFQKACPLLVPLVEEGWIDHEVTHMVAKEYLEHIVDCGVDTVILGCTHYPLIKGVLADVVGHRVILVDSAEETASAVEEVLAANGIAASSPVGARCELYVSDMHLNLRLQIERFLGFEVPRIRVVNSEFQEVELQGI